MPKIIVYVRSADWKVLETQGKNVPEWVRGLVRYGIQVEKEKK